MPAHFDWQTEDDDRREGAGWDEAAETSPIRAARRPRWRLLGIIGGLLLAVAALVWWRVDRRIDATTQAIRTDVIASHNLVQRAAADGDAEVFRSFLSGRDPDWTAGELALFESGLFSDRASLGLSPPEGSLPAVLPALDEETSADEYPATITLSPDLNEAVVLVDQPYRLEDGSTVVLQQTTVYRRGDRRWLLAPPMEEFWGEWQTSDGEYLSLIYPERDADVALRLADDLDAAIADMCATLTNVDCSADLYLTVRLDGDPQALVDLSLPVGALRRARENASILKLPAPSLAGRPPADEPERERAYIALRNGYARHVLGAAIAQSVSWRCCESALLFSLLLDYQLAELDLLPEWPVGADDYRRVLDEQTNLARLNLLTSDRLPRDLDPDRLWAARVAVDFLLNAGDLPAADVQRRLATTRTFTQLARRVLDDGAGGRPVPSDPTQALWLHALMRAAAAEEEASPPDDTLYLVCTAPGESETPETSRLLRHEPAANGWTELHQIQGFVWMTPLPGRQTMLLQEFHVAGESWQTRYWRNGDVATAYVATDSGSAISLGQSDPDGHHLVVYIYDDDSGEIRTLVLDLQACGESCAVADAPGMPLWSPDGEWALYSGDGEDYPESALLVNDRYVYLDASGLGVERAITLGSGDVEAAGGAAFVANGYAPFWLDERTFGFIRQIDGAAPAPRAEQEIVVATIDNPTPQTLILGSDLFQFMPDDIQRRSLTLAYVMPIPRQPATLFVVAMDELSDEAYAFLYDRTTGRIELRLTLQADFNHSFGLSPDGRYAVMTGVGVASSEPNSNLAPLLIHDIDANRTTPLLARLPFFLPSAVYDWTTDGHLAVALDDNLIGLIHPPSGQVELLRHSRGACTSVAWLEE